jgi:hypothetical protein
MTNNLNDLGSRIKQELTDYQHDVSQRLTAMLEQRLISPIEKDKIWREAILTGQAILNALQSPVSQSQELTEIHIYALFENYKRSVESRLNPQPSFNPFDFLFKGINFNNSPKPKRKKNPDSQPNQRPILPEKLAKDEDNNNDEDSWE